MPLLNFFTWFCCALQQFFCELSNCPRLFFSDNEDDENDEDNKIKPKPYYSKNEEEEQYLDLAQYILDYGTDEMTRNGETRNFFGATLRFSLENGKIPLLTTKRVAWKTVLKELLWMIRGQTHNSLLQKQGVHIWDGNSSREFLDKSGLTHYEEGELGPIYGWQMRKFNAKYICEHEKKLFIEESEFLNDLIRSKEEYDAQLTDRTWTEASSKKLNEKGVDQLQYVIDLLKNPETRNSRRIVMSYWNPCQLEEMALPPCHCFVQFHVSEGKRLSCALTMRSNDLFLGQPFNIASYSFLTHLLAKHCDLEPYEFILFAGNCHIYKDHFDAVNEQLTREPLPFPLLNIRNKRDNIEDYEVDDFSVIDYNHYAPLFATMVA